MDADKVSSETELALQRGITSLLQTTNNFLQKEVELTRICRLATLLINSGINPNAFLFKKIAERCIANQKNDGGWADVPETMWCTCFLNLQIDYNDHVEKALKWLNSQSPDGQGWGNSSRDSSRITVTGMMLYFLPQLSFKSHLKWLENEWKKERQNEPCLGYKAAFTLMAFWKNSYKPDDKEIIPETIRWLIGQQNEDGGWAPWKGHPVGSDPWCTGICLVSLIQYPEEFPGTALWNGMGWIKEKQLPNGLWPYHYIDDGSAWAQYALTLGYSLLSKKRE